MCRLCEQDGCDGRLSLSGWCLDTEVPAEDVSACGGDDGCSDASMWDSDAEDTDSSARTSESEWEWDADSQGDEDYEPVGL